MKKTKKSDEKPNRSLFHDIIQTKASGNQGKEFEK